MSSLWIVRFFTLMVLQLITSFVLIYHRKNKLSFITEVLLCMASIFFFRAFSIELIVWHALEYIAVKTLLVIIVWTIRRFSFYVLVKISQRKAKGKKINSNSFLVKPFLRFISHMWRHVNYGIRIKKGMPSKVNTKHEATGIRFDKDGFPCFKAIATVRLDKKFHNKTRDVHFYQANKLLYATIIKNRKVASRFFRRDIYFFKHGQTPSRFTWHHHQDNGVMQLVSRKTHEAVRHDGGYSIWGKR